MYRAADPRDRYRATVLSIINGPANPYPIGPDLGGGTRPVLVRDSESNLRIIPPDELPLGKVVQVTGIMGVNHAWTVRRPENRSGGCLKRRLYLHDDAFSEHVIEVMGEIKVLEDQSAAATRPASRPVAPGTQSPLAAAIALGMAWVDVDLRSLRAAVCADTPAEQRQANAFADFVGAAQAMYENAAWKFHPIGAWRILGSVDPTYANWAARLILRDLDAPDSNPRIETHGARAAVAVAGVGAIRLRQDKGQWRVLLPIGQPRDDPAAFYDKLAALHQQFAKDIAAGKYANADEAAKAFAAGVAAITGSATPGTRPTTRPK